MPLASTLRKQNYSTGSSIAGCWTHSTDGLTLLPSAIAQVEQGAEHGLAVGQGHVGGHLAPADIAAVEAAKGIEQPADEGGHVDGADASATFGEPSVK